MIKSFIKGIVSEKRLEKILRAKYYLNQSKLFQSGLNILPPTSIRIGNEIIQVGAASNITIRGWRTLIDLYKKVSPSEQSDFRVQIKSMIMASTSSWILLETKFVRSIFKDHEAMYFDFLGIAYYAKGDLKKAYNTFTDLYERYPDDTIFLHRVRCYMHIATVDELISLLKKGCEKYPKSYKLLMSLSNAYFRDGKTSLANETLQKIDPEVIQNIRKNSHNLEILENEIKDALKNKEIVRPVEKLGFQAYTEESVQKYWEDLFFHFTAKNRFQHGWSDLCYITEEKISDYLNKYKDIKSVLNFGVFCAVPDYNLAIKHADRNFLGVDREQKTKNLNEDAFTAPNLSFHAIDMLDITYEDRNEVKDFVRKEMSKGEMMIFHARTTTLIYAEAIKNFYKSCAALKVKYIAVYENMTLSRSNMKYFDFDELPADSIPYYSIMMIHNYKKFLEEAGYEIVEKEVWNYSELLWEGKDLYGVETWLGLGDSHVCLLARLK